MKANVPEKIYVHEASAPELTEKLPYHIEYIRTDAFVKKACELLARMVWEVTYDCLSEGIFFYNQGIDYGFTFHGTRERYGSAKFAFAALIDALNDRGTWERNEWQFAYQFKLIK